MVTAIPAVYMRGGTSKGLFFKTQDLPPMGSERDELLLRVMGSPDALQIDGMGGTTSSTSKVIVAETGINNSVKYWFAQIGVAEKVVDWSGNCGNLTTAVAPFAVNERIITTPNDGVVEVNLFNANTGVEILSELEIRDGKAITEGNFAIAGVPGTAAPIKTDYLHPAGAVLGSLLPLGDGTTLFETSFGRIEASLIDATNPYLFVAKSDVQTLKQVEELRAAAAVAAGAATDPDMSWREKPTVPRVVLVARNRASDINSRDHADIDTLTISMGKEHRGIPMTAALALAAARTVPDSIVTRFAGNHFGPECETTIRHPLGITRVHAKTDTTGALVSVGVTRTARTLMRGEVFV